MPETAHPQTDDLIELAGDLVIAYVSNNPIRIAELPALIGNIHATLTGLSGTAAQTVSPEDVIEKPTAARIRKSIRPEGLVSFIDGKTYQSLKRHLTRHGLDPDSYRERYGLSADYPMVCADYSARRSELAKLSGLGSRTAELKTVEEKSPKPVEKKRQKAA